MKLIPNSCLVILAGKRPGSSLAFIPGHCLALVYRISSVGLWSPYLPSCKRHPPTLSCNINPTHLPRSTLSPNEDSARQAQMRTLPGSDLGQRLYLGLRDGPASQTRLTEPCTLHLIWAWVDTKKGDLVQGGAFLVISG